MTRRKSCINGRFLTRPITGVDRYARELTEAMDRIVSHNEMRILVPEKAELIDCPELNNIEIVHWGKRVGYPWEQIDLYRFAKKEGLLTVNLCNTAPLLSPGIVCVHDMNVRENPSFFDWKFCAAYRVFYRAYSWNAKCLLTVSEFSKREIEKYYPATRGKIKVIPNAWQHVNRIDGDDSVLSKRDLKPYEYHFAMCTLAPNKNLKWIVETARLNPDDLFVVAGGINTKVFGEHDIPEAKNVRYLGYITDAESKALMASCKSFIYPTFYEGFGIPPMEALASGASTVAVSDTEIMHEVYGDSVAYLDPKVPEVDIDALCGDSSRKKEMILNKYSWNRSAELLLQAIEDFHD